MDDPLFEVLLVPEVLGVRTDDVDIWRRVVQTQSTRNLSPELELGTGPSRVQAIPPESMNFFFYKRLLGPIGLLIGLLPFGLKADGAWTDALAGMPLGTNVAQLNWSNSVPLLLPALQSNSVVKALIVMPGAMDEFYLMRRAKADLTNAAPTLLDALSALTNQTQIRVTFRPPLLLLHTEGDLLEPELVIEHQPTTDKLKRARFLPHALYNDRDWDFMEPILKGAFMIDIRPVRFSPDSWHFYRPTFAAWNLDDWEALRAVALTSKTKATIHRNQVVFELDRRSK
jgi:hypothetical protein